MLTKRTLALLTLPLIVFGGLAVARPWASPSAAVNSTAPAQLDSLLPVSSLRVESSEAYSRDRIYTGELEARRASELGFELGGLLTEVLVEEGAEVAAGEELARLDTRRLETSLAGARARRDGAAALLAELEAGPRQEIIAAGRASMLELEKELELAKARLARRESLVEKNAVSREVLEEAQRGVDVMDARLQTRKSALDELLAGTRKERVDAQRAALATLAAEVEALEVELDKSVLRAPFEGRIARRNVDEGAVVTTGSSVLRLVEDRVLEVRLGVPLAARDEVSHGDVFSLAVTGATLEAEVVAVLPELDPDTRTVTVLLAVDARDADVLPGQVAELRVAERVERYGFWVPVTALTRGERGLWTVYALASDADESERRLIERRDVEVLHTSGERAYVRGALRDGDEIIDAGVHRVVPGQEVRIASLR